MRSGFFKISRNILSWRWYRNLNTKGLFFYFLMSAAWKPYTDFETKKVIGRGQCLFSIRRAEHDTGMSKKEIRTALSHLESTGEIEKSADHLASVITIKKYDAYQNTAAEGYVKLPRWHSSWRWFEDLRASLLYLHIILTAAYKGTEAVNRGQVFTRLSTLSAGTGQTESEVRTDLAKLERAGLVSGSSTNRGRIITVTYYDLFQGSFAGRLTGTADENRQADVENPTGKGAQQLAGQLCFENGLGKPNSEDAEAVRGTPLDRQKGTPPAEKGHTGCELWGTPKGTPSIIEEIEEGYGRRGEEYAPARACPLPGSTEQQTGEDAPLACANDVAALYGRLCLSLPPVALPLTRRQRRLVTALVQQLSSRERVRQLFLKAEKSDFLSGRAGDGVDWQADFDWLIEADHAQRVLAGKYDTLWNTRTQRQSRGYTPADGREPTYDIDEYVGQSIARLLDSPPESTPDQLHAGSG